MLQMNSVNGLFGGAALIGIVATCWERVKTLLYRFTSMLIVSSRVEGMAANALGTHFWKGHKRSPFGERCYSSRQVFVRPLSRWAQVGYEFFGPDPVIFWKGFCPIIVGRAKKNNGNEVSARPMSTDIPDDGGTLTVTYLRGTWNIEQLIIKALDQFNDRNVPTAKPHRHFIRRLKGSGARKRNSKSYAEDEMVPGTKSVARSEISSAHVDDVRLLKWTHDEVGSPIPEDRKALEALVLPKNVEEVVTEIRRWCNSEAWYKEKQIPWRRGWLLYGKPGTGKTSLVRAIAQDLDLPVLVFDLASMSNDELISNWQEMMQSVPCIALMEDIDAVFKGRENVAGENGGGLTFDCFLNVLGGIEEANGVFLVITTNHIQSMDEALGIPEKGADGVMISSRPGRVDRVIELLDMDEDCRRALAKRILSDCPEHIEITVTAGNGDTGAQFQERCSQIALQDYWDKQSEKKEIELGEMRLTA